jgi:hypothetical protein
VNERQDSSVLRKSNKNPGEPSKSENGEASLDPFFT